MNKQFLNLLLCLSLMGFAACKKSEPVVPTPAEDDAAIKAFIAKKSWTAQATPEGVYVVMDVVGTGATPVLTDYINIKFKGYLLNETLMSNSKDSAIEFKISELIEGLKIGLQKFKVGGKGKIIIPAALAFGTQSSATIPANSNIYFDVELVSAQATNGEDKKIKDYIAKKGWTALPTPEGVYVVMDSVGSGPSPTLSSIIKVYYKGYMLDETVFDSNLAPKPAVEFQLSGLIRGWQIGFQQFKAGGKGKLLIPSAYAYGSSGSGAIPPNTPLVFEVELVSFR
jgi:FKBP-type peptidyl-prolyl cis-trans isomerase FkpA